MFSSAATRLSSSVPVMQLDGFQPLNPTQLRLLHSMIESSQSVEMVAGAIARYPSLLDTYVLQSQFNPEIVELLFNKNVVPSESYILRVCSLGHLEVVRLLCKYNMFERVLGDNAKDDESMAIYSGKRSVATILFECGCITRDLYQSFNPVWTQLQE